MVSELCSRSPSKIFFMKFNIIINGFSEGNRGLAESFLELIIINDINRNGVDSGDGKQGVGKGFTKQKALIKVIFKFSKQTIVLFGLHCETRKITYRYYVLRRFLIND